MKDLLLYMAKSLVDDPDSVTVTEVEGETTVLELRVAPEDMGKLIGRQGRIAKEIRTIIKSVAQRTGQNEHGTDHDNVGAGEVGVCVLEAQHTGGAQERGTEHADPAEIELAAQEHDHDHKQCDKGQDQMDTHNRFTPLTFIGFGYSSPEFAWDFRLIFACNCW